MSRPVEAAVAGLGGGLAIACLSLLGDTLAVPLLLAPFGASCVLVFGVPGSPFAHPRNVIGGYLVSAAVGLAAVAVLGGGAAGLAVGVGRGGLGADRAYRDPVPAAVGTASLS